MSKFYVIGKASPELLKKMHADPAADRGAVMKSMCESLGVKAISYEWLRGRFDVLFCVEGDYESVLAQLLVSEGFGSIDEILDTERSELLAIEGFEEEIVDELIERSKKFTEL